MQLVGHVGSIRHVDLDHRPGRVVDATVVARCRPGPNRRARTGAYLGAWVHPEAATSGSSFAVEQAALPTVVAATGHPLGILHVYAPWARPAPVASLRSVAGAGSIPLLDWGCGPDVAQLSTGVDDTLISNYASDLRAYGAPVLLRWCWEMNLVGPPPGRWALGFVGAGTTSARCSSGPAPPTCRSCGVRR